MSQRRQYGTKTRTIAEINVVPYVDVMLVLLVIFMITAPVLNQGVTVSLPQTHHAQTINEAQLPFVISIDRSGQYFLSQGIAKAEPMRLNVIATRILAERKLDQRNRRPVLIKADRELGYGKIIRVMDALKGVGIEEVGLVTDGAQIHHA